jgi:glutamyl-tRNA reductase
VEILFNGISYKNCPIQVREKLSLCQSDINSLYKKLHAEEALGEAVILQTCNRTEFYIYAKKDFNIKNCLAEMISEIKPGTKTLWRKYAEQKTGHDAVRHLFNVAAGLDSQMLGENQILSQLKTAYTESCKHHLSKLIFHRLLHTAFRAGKDARTQTGINCGAVSISLAAAALAGSKMNLRNCCAMVIGAGENAALAAKYLLKYGTKNLVIANRNRQKAKRLLEKLGIKQEAIGLKDVLAKLDDIDVLICSTASAEPVITFDSVKEKLSKRKKRLLIIDIAVPRDIDPKLGRFKCVSLYNIDQLDKKISAYRKKRRTEVPKAEKIIERYMEQFSNWLGSLRLVPMITKLNEYGTAIARTEAKRYSGRLGIEDEKLRIFSESLTRKLLHGPINALKQNGDEEPTAEQLQAAELINKMFLSK